MPSNLDKPSISTSLRNFRFQAYFFQSGIFILLVLGTLTINWKMIHEGLFVNSHDLLIHITWLQHFSKELSEGIWYPRWLAGTNFGYGSPTFVFYPPLVYYIGSALKLSGLDIESTMIVLFTFPYFGAGLSFYIYGHNRWGRTASLLGGLAYMTAPYLTLNVSHRGALAETWAIIWIPIGLWLTDRAIQCSKWRVTLAIFFTILALTHVPSLLICTIFWLIYTFCCLLNQSWKSVAITIGYAMIGFGIASPYLLPAILEKHLVQIDTMREVAGGFKANLMEIILSSKWNFAQGYIRPVFIYELLVIVLFMSIGLFFYRQDNARIKEISLWIFFLLILSFLMSQYSTPLWQSSQTLQMIQFPWRLLGLFSFGGAALCGIAVSGINKSKTNPKTFFLLVIIICIVFNTIFDYRLSLKQPTLSNPGQEILSKTYIQTQKALYDAYTNKLIDTKEYRPVIHNGYSTPAPVVGQPSISLVSGKASIQINRWASYNRIFNVVVQESSLIKVRTYYYPAWHLYINNNLHPIGVSSDGTIELRLEPGSYYVELNYFWTFAFTMGVIISSFSIITLIFLLNKKNEKNFSPKS